MFLDPLCFLVTLGAYGTAPSALLRRRGGRGNISRAAARLRISQPGVGRQIRDLEEELGLVLLARNGKSVRLTAAGKISSTKPATF
jgi:Mn-dependent DtxR family transcriptional regulator